MKCIFCNFDYKKNDLVLTIPSTCPLCLLGHGNIYNVDKYYKENIYLRKKAIDILKKPNMIHRLKCIVPIRLRKKKLF